MGITDVEAAYHSQHIPSFQHKKSAFISKLDEAWPNHWSHHTQPLITFLLISSCYPIYFANYHAHQEQI